MTPPVIPTILRKGECNHSVEENTRTAVVEWPAAEYDDFVDAG